MKMKKPLNVLFTVLLTMGLIGFTGAVQAEESEAVTYECDSGSPHKAEFNYWPETGEIVVTKLVGHTEFKFDVPAIDENQWLIPQTPYDEHGILPGVYIALTDAGVFRLVYGTEYRCYEI